MHQKDKKKKKKNLIVSVSLQKLLFIAQSISSDQWAVRRQMSWQ